MANEARRPVRLAAIGFALFAAAIVVIGGYFSIDRRTGPLLLESVRLAALVAAIVLFAATTLSWIVFRTSALPRRLMIATLVAWLFTPLYVQATAWQAFFLHTGLHKISAAGAEGALSAFACVAWTHAAVAIPAATLLIGIALRTAPVELEEQALLEGGIGAALWRVDLRHVYPALVAAAVWTVAQVAGQIVVTDLYAVRTYAEEIYTEFMQGASSGPLLSTAAAPTLSLAALLIVAFYSWNHAAPPHDRSAGRPMNYRLGKWRFAAALAAVAIMTAFFAVPLASLAFQAGVLVEQTPAGPERSWSAAKALNMTAESGPYFANEIVWSLVVGAAAATAALVVAIAPAWLARRGDWRAGPALLAIVIPLAVPAPLIGIALIAMLNRPGIAWLTYLYDYSILGPWAAQTIACLPAATLVLQHGFANVSNDLLDAATLDGAGPCRRLLWFVIPARRATFVLAWLVALAVALAETSSTLLVAPPALSTLPCRVFELLHYGANDRVAGVCLLTIAVVGLIAWIAVRLARRI